jgi:hypothetical protein
MVLVGNKADLESEWMIISTEEAKGYCEISQIAYIRMFSKRRN